MQESVYAAGRHWTLTQFKEILGDSSIAWGKDAVSSCPNWTRIWLETRQRARRGRSVHTSDYMPCTGACYSTRSSHAVGTLSSSRYTGLHVCLMTSACAIDCQKLDTFSSWGEAHPDAL